MALDHISILDVTPQLARSFGTDRLNLWESTILTFTVTNTSELGAKARFSLNLSRSPHRDHAAIGPQ